MVTRPQYVCTNEEASIFHMTFPSSLHFPLPPEDIALNNPNALDRGCHNINDH
jgi:hypothetical protein